MDFAGSSRDPGGTGKVVSVVKEMSDEELVDRMAGGDERALSELYARYARPVYTMGIRLLGDSHLAEELVQDAFTNVWRGVINFDLERGSFMTCLYRVTRNRATDLNRNRRVRPILAREEPLRNVSGGPEPEASVDGWDVAQALSRIPSEHREVLTLAYFEGLSQREISHRTGVPLGTIKSRTTAALKRLRQAMGDQEVQEGQRD
jgi:RNA polymerase sigma factor (sigma-70 family)